MRLFVRPPWRWTVSEVDMSILLFNGFLLLGFVVATVPDVPVLGSPGTTRVAQDKPFVKRCRHTMIYSMLQASCPHMELPDVPKHLQSDIEALDFSGNRMRTLKDDSLTPYKNLGYVYLSDNFITKVEEEAFTQLPYLKVLVLTQNGCDYLPKSLFQLPYLQSLYLDNNRFYDTVFQVNITSPIELLQLAGNKLTKIPTIGPQPNLLTLNVSENDIASVSTEDLAPFCSLKVLIIDVAGTKNQNPIKFVGCQCQALNAWVKLRQIKMKPEFFNCTTKNCANVQFSNRTYELYNECTSIIQLRVETEKARSIWTLVASCLGTVLFIVFVVLLCIHKRNRRRRRKQKEEQQLAANNANTELLNSNLTTGNS
ncbi:PREDICTED: uncharacterized protein LOC105567039 isoform X2 [Vollenhovia emeryi]|uniref:uncharacterized protein LOC105567039 isoform X2 n=1 Tax=Vollenhovia emeryi TaxID=411798 RepID=UPI0005F4A98F|nr:PREDICTED: uncharacterized protein LOC105567039 isoform X2 [Vollenhovia emeryi]XP_011876954.1 PREDICTED: uncharacterized protein LOC105567039 isoform X2 [Vollenhovia emeryi]XP_011876955.1 PREDICTED: uncharacterized protein LOC105567039 isoform X2 [Vollenhovia emeryi]